MTAIAQVIPTLGEFSELAKQGNVIPVFAESSRMEKRQFQLSKLDRGGYSFLFESTEKNDVSGRFSSWVWILAWFCQSYGARSNHRG